MPFDYIFYLFFFFSFFNHVIFKEKVPKDDEINDTWNEETANL